MKIIVAGCWRSGTTALFNIVRLICEADGTTYSAFSNENFTELEGHLFHARHLVIKAHKFRKAWAAWADLVVTTHRDAARIGDSMRRFKAAGGQGNGADVRNLPRGLEHWGLWQRHSSHMVWFNQLRRNPEKVIRQLLEVMQENPQGQGFFDRPDMVFQVAGKFAALKPPAAGIDQVTLLHQNHITKKTYD